MHDELRASIRLLSSMTATCLAPTANSSLIDDIEDGIQGDEGRLRRQAVCWQASARSQHVLSLRFRPFQPQEAKDMRS